MPKKIDHDLRKELILKTALNVFAQYGVKDTNLSLIAQNCGLARTTVYQYFSSSSEVYYYAIKWVTDAAFEKYSSDEWIDMDHVVDMILHMAEDAIKIAEKYMAEIINLIRAMSSIDIDVPTIVRKRTAKIRIAVCRVLRHGKKTGQIKDCNTEEAVETIIALIGSYCFQRTYFPDNAEHIHKVMLQFILSLKKED